MKPKNLTIYAAGLLVVILFGSACSTARGRFFFGASTGALVTGGVAAKLSPNTESVPMNALVFGLVGAIVGGGLAVLTHDDGKVPHSNDSIRQKEADQKSLNSKLYSVPISTDLPIYVRERILPPVVEEEVEKDTVASDRALHEPHKVYRILRNAELYGNPDNEATP